MVKYTINDQEETIEERYNIYLELHNGEDVYIRATNGTGTTSIIAKIRDDKGIVILPNYFGFKFAPFETKEE